MAKNRLRDMPSQKEGKGYININGRQLDAFVFTKLSLDSEVVPEERAFLGEVVKQHAARGLNNTGSIAFYHCTPDLIQAVKEYKNGGEYPEITLQGYAQVASRGRCEVIATDVIINKISLLSLDDGNDGSMIFESDITFDDFDIISNFEV